MDSIKAYSEVFKTLANTRVAITRVINQIAHEIEHVEDVEVEYSGPQPESPVSGGWNVDLHFLGGSVHVFFGDSGDGEVYLGHRMTEQMYSESDIRDAIERAVEKESAMLESKRFMRPTKTVVDKGIRATSKQNTSAKQDSITESQRKIQQLAGI